MTPVLICKQTFWNPQKYDSIRQPRTFVWKNGSSKHPPIELFLEKNHQGALVFFAQNFPHLKNINKKNIGQKVSTSWCWNETKGVPQPFGNPTNYSACLAQLMTRMAKSLRTSHGLVDPRVCGTPRWWFRWPSKKRFENRRRTMVLLVCLVLVVCLVGWLVGCLFGCLFACLFACLLVCLFACLFVCLFVCVFVFACLINMVCVITFEN